MKKRIIIEEEGNSKVKAKSDNVKLNKLYEWLIYMVGYSIVLVLASSLFKSFYINLDYFGLFAFLGAIIIYALNQTVKPVLIYMTLPITFITYGLFYPVINVLILYITSFILGNNFNVSGFIGPFFVAIFISILNVIVEGVFVKPLIGRKK